VKKLVTVALTFLMLFSAASFAAPNPVSAQEIYATNGHRIVNTAKAYQGRVTYRFGVRNPAQLIFDCSSFTQFVFQKNGRKIPWGSKAQARWGLPVRSKSQLSIGDLVFFSVNKPGQINHVGIYIGNGQFISNSPSRGVHIASIHTGYWGGRYITGRHY
jgi:lipoprotein Spr